MEGILIFVMLFAFAGYMASIVLGIILLVKTIITGIVCLKLGKFLPREQINFIDTKPSNVLWTWILVLSIFFALAFILLFSLLGDNSAVVVGLIAPALYLNPQLAILVAAKIILKKYSNAFVAYKMRERREKAEAAVSK